MKQKCEVCYFVSDVASVPVYKTYSRTEVYKQDEMSGWGAVEGCSAAGGYKNPVTSDHNARTQQLCCDEDFSANLYTKNSGYFGIFPYDEINIKQMPKQIECSAIVISDRDHVVMFKPESPNAGRE